MICILPFISQRSLVLLGNANSHISETRQEIALEFFQTSFKEHRLEITSLVETRMIQCWRKLRQTLPCQKIWALHTAVSDKKYLPYNRYRGKWKETTPYNKKGSVFNNPDHVSLTKIYPASKTGQNFVDQKEYAYFCCEDLYRLCSDITQAKLIYVLD